MRGLGLLVLAMFVGGSALADEVRFNCRFTSQVKGMEACQARGRICVETEAMNNHECRSVMEVACNQNVIYRDGLRSDFSEHRIRLEGVRSLQNVVPVILTPIPHSMPGVVSAWLKLPDGQGRGFCEYTRDQVGPPAPPPVQ